MVPKVAFEGSSLQSFGTEMPDHRGVLQSGGADIRFSSNRRHQHAHLQAHTNNTAKHNCNLMVSGAHLEPSFGPSWVQQWPLEASRSPSLGTKMSDRGGVCARGHVIKSCNCNNGKNSTAKPPSTTVAIAAVIADRNQMCQGGIQANAWMHQVAPMPWIFSVALRSH